MEDYFYDHDDMLTEIKIGTTVVKSFGYDGAGRRTSATYSGVTTYYSYDYESRIKGITRTGTTANSFAYNGFDTRVSKTDSSGTTSYKRAGAYVTDPLLKSTISSTTTDYTPGVSSRVSSTSPFDHAGLKNTDEQTNSGGSISGSKQYDAFGNLVSSNGPWAGPFGYGGPHGYQTDADHGLMLLGHRYYESDTGRFLTRDPIKDGRNWYGYCDGSPSSRSDPTGRAYHDPMHVLVSPNFEGIVIVIGEPGASRKQGWLRVPSGHLSPPGMDVDYVLVFPRRGVMNVHVILGLEPPFDHTDLPQISYVDANGSVHGGGLRVHYMLVWRNIVEGMRKFLGGDLGTLRVLAKTNRRPSAQKDSGFDTSTPVGAKRGASGSIVW